MNRERWKSFNERWWLVVEDEAGGQWRENKIGILAALAFIAVCVAMAIVGAV